MVEKNWALGDSGAKVVEVSHEAAHVASAASNLLVLREDLLWITGDAPQHVTLKIADSHPLLHYVGWHVWHDYLTNPKTVEIASGVSTDDMVAQLVCQAIPGAGTQIWKLPNAIPTNHLFVRIKILDTFGPGPTYMNNVVLFANDPGTRFRSMRNMELTAVKENEGSAGRMSVLLKELDEDIRALHPIKTVSPRKNILLYVPQEPTSVFPQEDVRGEEVPSPSRHDKGPSLWGSNGVNRAPQYSVAPDLSESLAAGRTGWGEIKEDIPRGFNDRLCALEQAVASLTQTMNHQREDLTMIKRLLLHQASERRRELEHKVAAAQHSSAQQQQYNERSHRVSRHQVSVDFPEDALRSFVENILVQKFQKYTKRTEAQTIAKLDDFLKDIVAEITNVVDDRVRQHLYQATANGSATLTSAQNFGLEGRKDQQFSTQFHPLKKNERLARVDCNKLPHSPPVPPSGSSASFATTLPVSTPRSLRGNDVGSVPVSILRDASTEIEQSFFKRENGGQQPSVLKF